MVFLAVEFFDELYYGIQGAALPVIRSELGLNYAQVGLLLGLPVVVGAILEPFIMLMGDTDLRQKIILGGGVAIALMAALIAVAQGFPAMLVALLVTYSSSGAFVSLSQATLMDMNPSREPQAMSRWSLAGSLGVTLGPLTLAGAIALGLSWRIAFAVLGLIATGLVLRLTRSPIPHRNPIPWKSARPRMLLRNLYTIARTPGMLRWLLLLQASDLMLDIFAVYLPLYYTDIMGVAPGTAGLVLGALMASGLLADILAVPILERMNGRSVVKMTAGLVSGLYVFWLVTPWPWVKFALVIAIGVGRLGWYAVLKGEVYSAAHGYSGTASALTSLASLLRGALAWFIGWVASQAGLASAMWLLLAGPMLLLLFVPPPHQGRIMLSANERSRSSWRGES